MRTPTKNKSKENPTGSEPGLNAPTEGEVGPLAAQDGLDEMDELLADLDADRDLDERR